MFPARPSTTPRLRTLAPGAVGMSAVVAVTLAVAEATRAVAVTPVAEVAAVMEAAVVTAIDKKSSPRILDPRAFLFFLLDFYAVTNYPQLDLLQLFFPATLEFPDPLAIIRCISNVDDCPG